MLVIFPFEEHDLSRGGRAGRIRRPSARRSGESSQSRAEFLAGRRLPAAAPTVGILPGSRPGEVARILPDLRGGCQAESAGETAPAPRWFLVARAPNLNDALVRRASRWAASAGQSSSRPIRTPCAGPSTSRLVASGTATVQGRAARYADGDRVRVSPWTYRLRPASLNVSTFGMVNLIAGSKIVPELIQDAFTPGGRGRRGGTSMLTRYSRGRRRSGRRCSTSAIDWAAAAQPPRR